MRASPRTWPSIRLSRLSTDVLALACMPAIYPHGVSASSAPRSETGTAMAHSACSHSAGSTVHEPTVTDPVCGMKVDPAKTPHQHSHDGHAYFFCSAGCRGKFIGDPGKYLRKEPAGEVP